MKADKHNNESHKDSLSIENWVRSWRGGLCYYYNPNLKTLHAKLDRNWESRHDRLDDRGNDDNQPRSMSQAKRHIKPQKLISVHAAARGLKVIHNQIENQDTDNNIDTINNSIIETPSKKQEIRGLPYVVIID